MLAYCEVWPNDVLQTNVYVLDTDILIDIQRGHASALAWFTTLTELPSVPGFVIMELVQGAQNAQQMRQVLKLVAPSLLSGRPNLTVIVP